MELDRSGRDGLLTLAAVGLGLIAARVILLRESGPLPAFVGIVLVMLSLGLAVRAYFARMSEGVLHCGSASIQPVSSNSRPVATHSSV